MRRLTLLFMGTALLMVVTALPVAATQPSEVGIVVASSLEGGPAPFEAFGAAVDDGVVCGTGVVNDLQLNASGFSQNGFNVHVIKQFICDDGSGGFLVNLQARIDFRKGVLFNWNVLSGTDHYLDLHGSGGGVGLPGEPCGDPELCILDIYDGGLHIN